MKIITAPEKGPDLRCLSAVKFGSAIRFHTNPEIIRGNMYGSSLEDPFILTGDGPTACVVNLKNGNTFTVDFYKTFVEVLDGAEVTL